jgi:hypothetical protein
MDAALHRERVDPIRRQVTHQMPAAQLPDGVMIRVGSDAGLVVAGQRRPWSFQGYGVPAGSGLPGMVEVLTPPSIVAAIAAGYRPLVHPSALTASSQAGGAAPGLRAHG